MARLTWENVNAPSFSGIGDNYRVMSQLLGNAAQSGRDMLDIFSNAQQENADRAILQRQLSVEDPAQYHAGQIIGSDGSRASLSTMRGVGDYAGTLLNRAAVGEALNQTKFDNHLFHLL